MQRCATLRASSLQPLPGVGVEASGVVEFAPGRDHVDACSEQLAQHVDVRPGRPCRGHSQAAGRGSRRCRGSPVRRWVLRRTAQRRRALPYPPSRRRARPGRGRDVLRRRAGTREPMFPVAHCTTRYRSLLTLLFVLMLLPSAAVTVRSTEPGASRRRRGHLLVRPQSGRRSRPVRAGAATVPSSDLPGPSCSMRLTAWTPSGALRAMASQARARAASSVCPGSHIRTIRPCCECRFAPIRAPR